MLFGLNVLISSSNKKFVWELKLVKMFGIVVFCFVFCWLLFEIINFMIVVNKGIVYCVFEIFDIVVCWFVYFYFLLNLFFYVFVSSEFRIVFRKFLYIKREEVIIFEIGKV